MEGLICWIWHEDRLNTVCKKVGYMSVHFASRWLANAEISLSAPSRMIPSMFSGVNINLVIPVFIVFALMRIKAVFNVALRLISGLRFFTQRRFAAISKAPANPTPGDIIEKSIAQLNLTMIELDDSMATTYVLKTQLFYDLYEAMVNLGVGCFLAYVWSVGFHCAVPDAVASCWVVLLILALAVFSFQCLLQILIMTGWRAKETKVAIIIGFVVFLVSMVQFLGEVSFIDLKTSTAVAVHVNALLVQLSPDISAINLSVLVPLIQVGMSIGCALMCAGLVIPALRYSQALDTLAFGTRATLLSSTDKGLLWLDFVLPLLVGVAFSPIPQLVAAVAFPASASNCTAPDGTAGTCTSDASTFGVASNLLMTAQLLLVGAMTLTRLLIMKKHLQCFLDTVVRVVSAHLMATQSGQTPDQSQLLPRVKACTDYLMAAATQYIAVPLFVFACVLLLHKSSPVGTGVCYTIYEAAKLPSGPLLSSITAAAQFNSSALALETASQPYFTTILRAAAGAQMTGANLSGTNPTEAITAFALKFSGIYAFPAEVAVALCKALICMHSLMWFGLNLAGLLAWRFKPSIIVG